MKPTPPATASTSTSLLHALKTPMFKNLQPPPPSQLYGRPENAASTSLSSQ